MKIIKLKEDYRCKFCGQVCESYSYKADGFIETFSCSNCKYKWNVEINSKILFGETFTFNKSGANGVEIKILIVDYEKETTNILYREQATLGAPKFLLESTVNKLVKTHSLKQLKNYAFRLDILK